MIAAEKVRGGDERFRIARTRYAESGDVSIAYQAMGDGPIDMIMVPGFVSHIEFAHELPGYTALLRRLASFARVVTFDKRGQGLSDRMSGAPRWRSAWTMSAPSWTRSARSAPSVRVLRGWRMSVLFAATYPERVSHLF